MAFVKLHLSQRQSTNSQSERRRACWQQLAARVVENKRHPEPLFGRRERQITAIIELVPLNMIADFRLVATKLICQALLFGLVCQSTTLAFQGNESQERPEHSLARIGDYGDCPDSNGTYRLEYSTDGRYLAARSRENAVTVFRLSDLKEISKVEGHDNNWVETISFSPDSRLFVTAAGPSEKVKVWETDSGELVREFTTNAKAAYFNKSGKSIVMLGDSSVETFDWLGDKEPQAKTWKQNETRSAMSRDGRYVIGYQSLPRQIYQTVLVNMETQARTLLGGPTSIPKSVIVSKDGNWVAAAYHRDSKIRLWDLRDPHNKKYTLTKHIETVQSICFSPDSNFLISTGWDERVIAWDLLTRQDIHVFEGHLDHVNACAFDPLKLQFATAASGKKDCSTIIWDLKPVLLSGHAYDTFDEAWSKMGAYNIKTSWRCLKSFVDGGDKFLESLDLEIAAEFREKLGSKFDELVALLNSPKYKIREEATQKLLRLRAKFDSKIREAFQSATIPEVKYRLSLILKEVPKRPKLEINEYRRWQRLIFALELINTELALDWLERIGSTHKHPDINRAAQGALERARIRNASPNSLP